MGIQRELLGDDVPDVYVTLEWLALSSLCVTRFDELLPVFDEIAPGLEDCYPHQMSNTL